MNRQKFWRQKATMHLDSLDGVIHVLKGMGPSPEDGWAALRDIQGRLAKLTRFSTIPRDDKRRSGRKADHSDPSAKSGRQRSSPSAAATPQRLPD